MAYGVNAPFGFKPSVHLSGTPIVSSDQNEYFLASGYATALFTGDPVVMLANGTIGRAVAGAANPFIGIFCGVKYIDPNTKLLVNSPFWTAGQVTQNALNALAYVWDAGDILYDVQSDTTLGVNGIQTTDLGQNANIAYNTAGSTISGQSGATILGLGAGPTLQVKIVRFTPRPGNNPGTQNNNVLVLPNTYFWAPNSAGI